VKITKCAGKALILALFCVSAAACHKQADTASLQSSVSDPQARTFYEARQWKAAWDKKSEKALIDIIDQAPTNGLKPDLFLKEPLPKDANAREAALTNAALRYASALARGVADPKKISAIYTIPRPRVNVAPALAEALAKGDLATWYATLPPQTEEYSALSQAHLRYLQLAARAKPSPIPSGKRIKPGHSDQRVPFVAAALIAEGYLGAAPPGLSQHYTPQLVAAVKALQADWGMKPSGVIDDDTISVLNLGPAGLARELAIAMERLRWLDRNPPDTRIDVNTAAAFLDYWRSGQHIDRRNVVPGEPDKPTPQIQASFSNVVANPYWRIPDSIYKEELADKGPGYLAENNMTFQDGKLVQLPGPKNSLGLVKFDMQDPQQIYMHDTPAKALFSIPERHRSHGCVRVEGALQFASMLTTQDNVFDKFDEALASGEERWVKLKTEIPVRLLYHTAFFDGARVQFRPDVYGWDDDVAMALGLVRGPVRKAYHSQDGDLGP
jgi:murein L,D-transpeptidase YcbB/YkuD